MWARHFYLVHIKLNSYMKINYKNEWEKMKDDTGWYRPKWATIYYSRAVYKFIWKSDENFNDVKINILKRKIRRFVWELPLYLLVVAIITILLIRLEVL